MSVQAAPPLEERQKPPRRRKKSAALYEVVLPLIATAGLFLLWEAACRAFKIPGYLLPAPSEIWKDTLAIGPTVAGHTMATFKTVMLGFVVSILISLPLAVLAVSLVVFINEASYRTTVDSVGDMERAQSTRSALNELMQSVLDAETGQRGYLLTGNQAYLEPYYETLKTINQQLDDLHITFTPYQEPLSDFGVMSRHISRKLAEMDLSIKMRDAGQEDAWRFVLTTDV
eukprot:gene58560-78114_t